MRYLSPEWLDAAGAAARGGEAVNGERLVVQHIVEGGPDGDVAYHVELGGGGAAVRPGTADAPDVTFRQSYATAVDVAQGRRSAKEAFLAGEVRVGGDVTRLLGRDAAFETLEGALASLRDRTTF